MTSGDPNILAVASFGFCSKGFGCMFLSLEALPEHTWTGTECARSGCSMRGHWGLVEGGGTQALKCQQPAHWSPKKGHLGPTVRSTEAKAMCHTQQDSRGLWSKTLHFQQAPR